MSRLFVLCILGGCLNSFLWWACDSPSPDSQSEEFIPVPDSLMEKGQILLNTGHPTEALSLFQTSEGIFQSQNAFRGQIAAILSQASAWFYLAEYDSARAECRRAESLFQTMGFPPDDSSRVEILSFRMADEGMIKGNWRGGLDLAKEAWRIQLKSRGANHPTSPTLLMNLSQFYIQLGQYDSALVPARTGRFLHEQQLSEHPSEYAIALNVLGNIHYELAQYDSSKWYAKQAIQIRKVHLPPNHPDLANDLNLLALTEADLGNFSEYRRYTLQAIHHLDQSSSGHQPSPLRYTLLYNLGTLYGELGKFDSALLVLKQVNSMGKMMYGKENPQSGTILSNMGMIYLNQGEPALALLLYRQAFDIHMRYSSLLPDELAIIYNGLGTCYEDLQEYDSAWHHFSQAWIIRDTLMSPLDPDRAFSLGQLANTARKLGRTDEAIRFLKESIAIYSEIYDNVEAIPFARTYRMLAEVYHQTGQLQIAEKWARKSLEIYAHEQWVNEARALAVANLLADIQRKRGNISESLNTYNELIETASKPRHIHQLSLWHEMASAYAGKARLYQSLSQAGNDASHYTALAWEATRKGIQVLDSLRMWSVSDSSRQRYAMKCQPMMEQLLELTEELSSRTNSDSFLIQAFETLETFKSYLLQQSIRGLHLTRQYNLADSLIQQEKSHSQWIAFYRQKIKTEERAFKPSLLKLKQWETKLLQRQQQLLDLRGQIKTEYPAYFLQRYQARNPSVGEIQLQVGKDSLLLLECYWGTKALYVLGISQSEIRIHTIPITSELTKGVKGLHANISSSEVKDTDSKFLQAFVKLSRQLYQQLLQPWERELNLSNSLVFIPDGPLAGLPVEILLRHDPEQFDYHFFPYLIKTHRIQYAHSYTLWEEMRSARNAHQNNGALLAVAPQFEDHELRTKQASDSSAFQQLQEKISLSPLQENEHEMDAIPSIFNKTVLMGHEATETRFREDMESFQILHVATHAGMNPDDPLSSCLFFSQTSDSLVDDQLSMLELLGHRIEADLVVLSACETGIGAELAGEGAMSMGHSFAKAGAASVLASLWQVDDNSTSVLMNGFYEALAEGMNQAEALRQAKLRYLEENDTQNRPFFWGAWVMYGDTRPIVPEQKSNGVLLLLMLIPIGVGMWLWRKNS